MADVMITKTQMTDAGSVGTAISAMATAILREEAVLARWFRDVSQFAVKGVDKIVFPGLGKFTVANRASGATNDKQAPTVFKDSLNLDQNAYIKYGIDGSDEVQSTLDWKLECARIAAQDHVEYFEGKLLAAVETYAQPVSFTLVDGDIEEARTLVELRKAYVQSKSKLADALYIISEELEAKILANPQLLNVAGFGQALIENGSVKKIYGIPVEVKLNITVPCLVNTKAINYGFQKAPKYAEQPDVNFGTDGVLCAMDQLFGVGASYVIPVGDTNAGKSKVIFKVGTVTPAA